MIDYKDLLKKYINFVTCLEGYNFLSSADVGDEWGDSFTESEMAELERLSREDD